MSKQTKALIGVMIALALGAVLGWVAGRLIRSDNVPFFIALGMLAGIWSGLIWVGLQKRGTR